MVVKGLRQPDVMAHGFNHSTGKAKAGEFLFVSGEPGLYSETLFQKQILSRSIRVFLNGSVCKDRAMSPVQSPAYPLRKNTLRVQQGTQNWHGN